MSLAKIISIILVIVFFTGCEVIEWISYNPDLSLSFDIEKSNSENNFSASAEKILQSSIRSDWRYYNNSSDSVTLIKELSFDILLTNNDTLVFGFWFIKYEDSDFLVMDNDTMLGKSWHYKEVERALENFYSGFREARVMVNNNVIFHTNTNEDFMIADVRDLMIKGEKKNYLELYFSGNAYGWYDPSGEYQEVFIITNGHLSGVVE